MFRNFVDRIRREKPSHVQRAISYSGSALSTPELNNIRSFLTSSVFRNHSNPYASNFHNNLVKEIEKIHEGEDPRQYAFATIMWMKGYDVNTTAKLLGKSNRWVKNFWNNTNLTKITKQAPIDKFDNLGKLVDEIVLDSGDFKVAMGTTPSGEIHLANMYTLFGSAYMIAQIASKKNVTPSFQLGVNDMTLKPKQYRKLDSCLNLLGEALGQFLEQSGINIDMLLYSDLQRTEEFRETLTEYQRNYLFGRRKINLEASKPGKNKFKKVEESEAYDVDFRNNPLDFSSDLTGTIALKVFHSKPDLYVLGGDFGHGNNPLGRRLYPSEFQRPKLFSPGVFYGVNGEEMHVSSGNHISYQDIKDNDWFGLLKKVMDDQRRIVGPLDYWNMLTPAQKDQVYVRK